MCPRFSLQSNGSSDFQFAVNRPGDYSTHSPADAFVRPRASSVCRDDSLGRVFSCVADLVDRQGASRARIEAKYESGEGRPPSAKAQADEARIQRDCSDPGPSCQVPEPPTAERKEDAHLKRNGDRGHPTDAGQQTFPGRRTVQRDSGTFLRRTNEPIPIPLVNRDRHCYLRSMNLKASRNILPLAGE